MPPDPLIPLTFSAGQQHRPCWTCRHAGPPAGRTAAWCHRPCARQVVAVPAEGCTFWTPAAAAKTAPPRGQHG